mmetsp:Transcript_55066/g.103298  ORF Transcript_55066/g.103298 Transcript_55066/m.103298 type:complete len:509 (-) Transcript_55066:116-1642(-)
MGSRFSKAPKAAKNKNGVKKEQKDPKISENSVKLTSAKSDISDFEDEAPLGGVNSVSLTRENSGSLATTVPKNVQASHVTMEELREKFRKCTTGRQDAEQMRATLTDVADLLSQGVGGMIVAVINADILASPLKFHYLDGGLHTETMRDICKTIGEQQFSDFLYLLTAHNESDRWEDHELVALTEKIPKAADYSHKLINQPKDGGIVVSHHGTVKGAAMHIKYPSSKLQLVKSNGTAAGTRHASALGFAEYLCRKVDENMYPGVVFARSDGGGAHAFIPEECGVPTVMAFETLKIPTQKDMVKHFKDRITDGGQLMIKKLPQLARVAIKGETIISVVDGQITSHRVIQEESMVLRANNQNQELYALQLPNFQRTYQMPGHELKAENIEFVKGAGLGEITKEYFRVWSKQLRDGGWMLYEPKAKARWVYEVKAEDLRGIATTCFQAPWDEQVLQPLKPGTILGMPEDFSEVYWMPSETLIGGSYIPIDPLTKKEIKKELSGLPRGRMSL